jgi:hypothetical protein
MGVELPSGESKDGLLQLEQEQQRSGQQDEAAAETPTARRKRRRSSSSSDLSSHEGLPAARRQQGAEHGEAGNASAREVAKDDASDDEAGEQGSEPGEAAKADPAGEQGHNKGRFSLEEKKQLFTLIRDDACIFSAFLHQRKERMFGTKSWMHEIANRFNQIITGKKRSLEAIRHHLMFRKTETSSGNAGLSIAAELDKTSLELQEHFKLCHYKGTCTKCLIFQRVCVQQGAYKCGYAACNICNSALEPVAVVMTQFAVALPSARRAASGSFSSAGSSGAGLVALGGLFEPSALQPLQPISPQHQLQLQQLSPQQQHALHQKQMHEVQQFQLQHQQQLQQRLQHQLQHHGSHPPSPAAFFFPDVFGRPAHNLQAMLLDKSNRQGQSPSQSPSWNARNNRLGVQQQYDNAVYDWPAMTPTSGYLLNLGAAGQAAPVYPVPGPSTANLAALTADGRRLSMPALLAAQPRGEFDQHAAKEQQDHSFSSFWPQSLDMDQDGSKKLLPMLQQGLFHRFP